MEDREPRSNLDSTRRSRSRSAPNSNPDIGNDYLRKLALANNGIVFLPLHELEAGALGESVHLKGFAARVNFEDADTKKEATRTITFISSEEFDSLVWDGDDFRPDSFTNLIPEIYTTTSVLLVMFLRDTTEERDRVEMSWGAMNLPIICILCPSEISFQELGAQALKTTGSTKVVCFGGGAVVDDEIKQGSTEISYHYFRAKRLNAANSVMYDSSVLEGHVLQIPGGYEQVLSKGSTVFSGLGSMRSAALKKTLPSDEPISPGISRSFPAPDKPTSPVGLVAVNGLQ